MQPPNAIPAHLIPHLPEDLRVGTYTAVHAWAAAHPADFWEAVWAATEPHHARTYALARLGKRWFIGSKVNLAAQVLEAREGAGTALLFRNELIEEPIPFDRAEQYGQVASMAAYLRDQGIGKGDTIGVYMPVVPEALFALYAAWSIGARVCYCGMNTAPTEAALRFADGKVELLVAADGYRRAGKPVDRMPALEALQQQVPKLRCTVLFTYLDPNARWDQLCDTVTWLHTFNADAVDVNYRYVGFNQDGWISKGREMEQGGLLLTALKYGLDTGIKVGRVCLIEVATEAERLLWAVRVQLCGGVPVLTDAAPNYPNAYAVWKTAKDAGAELVQLPIASLSGEALTLGSYQSLEDLKHLILSGDEIVPAWVQQELPDCDLHTITWDEERGQLQNWRAGAEKILTDHHGDTPLE